MEAKPVKIIPVHDAVKPKLCDLYENDAIFDKFEVTFNHDASYSLFSIIDVLLTVYCVDLL